MRSAEHDMEMRQRRFSLFFEAELGWMSRELRSSHLLKPDRLGGEVLA